VRKIQRPGAAGTRQRSFGSISARRSAAPAALGYGQVDESGGQRLGCFGARQLGEPRGLAPEER
jgi:hypothetical protein